MYIFLFIIASLIAFTTYLSVHLYFSFFNNYNIYVITPIIFVILALIFSSFLFKSKIEALSSTAFTSALFFIIFFIWGILLYAITCYLVLDILKPFVKISAYKSGIIVITVALLISIVGYINTRFIREVTYNLTSTKIHSPAKIVLISDLHIGSPDITLAKMQKLITKINKQNPDLVIIAGDIVDDSSFDPIKIGYGKYFDQIKAKYGVFATIGNHDLYKDLTEQLVTNLEKHNMKFIQDTNIFIKNLNINLVGINDTSHHNSLAFKINKPIFNLKDMPLDKDNFNLIIEHNPIKFSQNAKYNIDLQVSGHTHAGQNIYGYLIEKLIFDKPWGLFQKDNATLITSSGIGTWGPPIRDISYPEMVIINLIPKK